MFDFDKESEAKYSTGTVEVDAAKDLSPKDKFVRDMKEEIERKKEMFHLAEKVDKKSKDEEVKTEPEVLEAST